MNVRTLCLGILNFEDSTGYEIRKMSIDGKYSHFVDASYGSIYPALNKLEADELVTCRSETQPGKPARKIYSIAPAGRAELVKSLCERPSQDIFRSEFLMIAISAEMLPRDVVSKAIDAQAEHLRQELSMIEQIECDSVHPSFHWAANYGKHCMTQSLKYLEDNRPALEAFAGTNQSQNQTNEAGNVEVAADLTGAR